MCKFRDLRADEIEVRIGQVGSDYFTLLLYKNARVDMDILDETVGAENWQRQHSRDNANCSVGIYDEKKAQWVWKEDTGTESNTEAEKGLASDSFKRACVNWGIGRKLYSAPFIYVQWEIKETAKGKKIPKGLINFEVTNIAYDDKKITTLEIWAYDKEKKKDVKLFTYGDKSPEKPQNKPNPTDKPTAPKTADNGLIDGLPFPMDDKLSEADMRELELKNILMDDDRWAMLLKYIKQTYGKSNVGQLTVAEYEKIKAIALKK